MDAAIHKTVLLSVFFFGGALLLVLGVLILRRLRDGGSVEVDAECVEVCERTETIGVGPDRTYFHNARRPVYRYYYEGRCYVSGPMLSSNRRGYRPEKGRCCTIRINPRHPERVYSPERKYVALTLIATGALWLALAVLAARLLPA